jgi:drug/metabolite transporter (DMT)-like permease
VARGSAPVLVLIGATAVLGRGAGAGQVAGVVTVAAGILLVRGVRPAFAPGQTRAFLLALLSGAFIAGYTLVDKEGLRHAAPIPYLELVLIGPAALYALAIAQVRGRAALRAEATPALASIGIVLFATYVLVLFALRLAPAASVSAVRESSVVVAAGLAALTGHERVSPGRVVGAVLVAAGIALLTLSR